MVRNFPRQALRISRLVNRRLVVVGLLLSMAATGQALPALATSDTAVTSLRPYSARYETTTRGMSLTLDRELKTDGEGNYTLTNGGRILVFGFYEVAVFRIEDAKVKPKSYVFRGTGLISRRREVHFSEGSDTVRSLYKGDWYELPYVDGTLDRMSQQEQLRLLLLNDPTPEEDVTVRIADGRKIKDYQLVFVGEELLETSLGQVFTLHFKRDHSDPERKSDIWLAPHWDYLMVKTIHVEDGKPVEVIFNEGAIDGQPLVAVADSAP